MFTLKFYQYFEGNQYRQTVICAKQYEIVDTGVSKFVIIDDVEYLIGDNLCEHADVENVHIETGFDACYIENSTGKTIDTIRKY